MDVGKDAIPVSYRIKGWYPIKEDHSISSHLLYRGTVFASNNSQYQDRNFFRIITWKICIYVITYDMHHKVRGEPLQNWWVIDPMWMQMFLLNDMKKFLNYWFEVRIILTTKKTENLILILCEFEQGKHEISFVFKVNKNRRMHSNKKYAYIIYFDPIVYSYNTSILIVWTIIYFSSIKIYNLQ